jgi:hypothetical protein
MDAPTEGLNAAVLAGTLSSDPREVVLDSGTRLLRLEVTTRASGATASVPVAWFDPPRGGPTLAAGDAVLVVGTVRRRWFGGPGGARSTTEVVADRVVPTRRQAATRRALASVARTLGAAADP